MNKDELRKLENSMSKEDIMRYAGKMGPNLTLFFTVSEGAQSLIYERNII